MRIVSLDDYACQDKKPEDVTAEISKMAKELPEFTITVLDPDEAVQSSTDTQHGPSATAQGPVPGVGSSESLDIPVSSQGESPSSALKKTAERSRGRISFLPAGMMEETDTINSIQDPTARLVSVDEHATVSVIEVVLKIPQSRADGDALGAICYDRPAWLMGHGCFTISPVNSPLHNRPHADTHALLRCCRVAFAHRSSPTTCHPWSPRRFHFRRIYRCWAAGRRRGQDGLLHHGH